jgi:hypothetical protein
MTEGVNFRLRNCLVEVEEGMINIYFSRGYLN